MSDYNLEMLFAEAMARLQTSINRSAAQHLRRFKTYCARQDAAMACAHKSTKTPSSPCA